MSCLIESISRVTAAGCLLMSLLSALGCSEDDRELQQKFSSKLDPTPAQGGLKLVPKKSYPPLLSRVKWKPTDFFKLRHNLDMCQAITDENYKVIDAATKDQVNSQERYGMTILHWAFLTGDAIAFEKLLQRGADLHLKFTDDIKGDHVIFQKDSQVMFSALYQWGYGLPFFRIGLEYITDPNCRSLRENGNLIHEYIFMFGGASSENSLATIKQLLELGCDPNAADSRGGTPCMYAVGYHMPEDAILMLDYGADPNVKNKRGQDLKAVVEQMLKNGVPVPRNKEDLTDAYLKLAERVGANVDFEALKAAKAAKP